MNFINAFLSVVVLITTTTILNRVPNCVSINANRRFYVDTTADKLLALPAASQAQLQKMNKTFKVEKKEFNIFTMKAHVEISGKMDGAAFRIVTDLNKDKGKFVLRSRDFNIDIKGKNIGLFDKKADFEFTGNWEGDVFSGVATLRGSNLDISLTIFGEHKIFATATIREINGRSLINITAQTTVTTRKARLGFVQRIINRKTWEAGTQRANAALYDIHQKIIRLMN